MVPDGTLGGAAAGDVVHLLAELVDNALRYSPPASPVRVSAGCRSDAAVLIQITDAGLGMTDGDRRIANMRLRAGGEVTPDNARHMGLFVVGRLADRHGLRVRLRGSSLGEADSGTTAEVYLPPTVLTGAGEPSTPREPAGVAPAVVPLPEPPAAGSDYVRRSEVTSRTDAIETQRLPVDQSSVTLLPHRSPGSSGITGVPAAPPEHSRATARPAPGPGESAGQPAAQPFRTPRPSRRGCGQPGEPVVQPTCPAGTGDADLPEVDDVWTAEAAAPATQAPADDLIYQRMLSEWLVDPRELAHSPDLDWQSVWDRGWSAAEEVESVPVQAHTDHGLPVREPGARLVPGGADREQNGNAHHRASEDNGIASNGGFQSGRTPAHEAPVRDADAVRASISSHFGGVRAGRSHARETDEGTDHE